MGTNELKVLIACAIGICIEPSLAAQDYSDSIPDIELAEVAVKAPTTRHLINGDEYLVTKDMRDRSSNIPELLNLLPGIKQNRLDDNVSIENKNNVILLVNGERFSIDYIKSINPDKVVRIRVIKNPTGRYASEGYDGIIDLKIRNYDGFEFSISNFSIINPNNNGKDKIMMEQPLASFSYTHNKISVFGSNAYGLSKWNTPYENTFKVENEYHMNSSGMEKYKYCGNMANLGLNYHIVDNHELSVELDYRRENANSNLCLTDQKTDINQTVINEDIKRTYGSSIFYKAQFGDKLNVYSELAYSFITGRGSNTLIHENQSKDDKTNIYENKHDIKYTFDTELNTSDLLSFKFGYQLGCRKLSSNTEFKYKNTRNKLWAYLNYSPSVLFSTEVGCIFEIERICHTNSNNYYHFLPCIRLNYNPTDNVNINLSYTANGNYPTLTMLNPVKTILHNGIFQQGNPSLESAIYHTIELDNLFFDMFCVNLHFDYMKNYIAFLTTPDSNNVIFTFNNVNLKKLTLPFSFNCNIGAHFNINADAAYYVFLGKDKNITHTVDGWWYGANLKYFSNGYMIDLGYNRSIVNENILQGYKQSGIDSWTMTANKQWFGGKLSTMITWFLPINWGLSESLKTQITTDYYNENTIQGLKPYRNAIIINLTYRFNKGKNKQTHKRSVIETEKRVSGGLKL